MINSTIIRSVTIDDLHSVHTLIGQLGYHLNNDEVFQTFNNYLNNNDYKIFVVENDKKIIACASIVIIRNLHKVKHFAQLTSLIVDRSFRNMKIGYKLLDFVENYSREHGCDKIQLTSGLHRKNSGAHRFYTALDYKTDVTQYFVKQLCMG